MLSDIWKIGDPKSLWLGNVKDGRSSGCEILIEEVHILKSRIVNWASLLSQIFLLEVAEVVICSPVSYYQAKLLLVNLGFSMCHTFWLETEQLSVLLIGRDVL